MSKLKISSSDEIFEILVKDGTDAQLARWVCKKKDLFVALKVLDEQFGLGLDIRRKKTTPQDLKWLNSDN